GAAGVVALAAGATAPERSLAQGAGPGASPGSPAAPKRMTFVTLRSGDAYSLGVKTDLGILDVAKTAKFFVRSPAPTTIEDLIRRGDRGLTQLVKTALARAPPEFLVAAVRYAVRQCLRHDFAARGLSSRTSPCVIGKTCDGVGPLGPYLVTVDQIPDPNNLRIEGTVNGEVRQSSNTSDMVHNCATIISYASTLMTLLPGDVIYTGTPEGVIPGYPTEKQLWLQSGDRLTTTIETLDRPRRARTRC